MFGCKTQQLPCTCCWLLLSRFSRVGLCATPETAAHQAPPSLGFSRQECWSGLLFPSPTHESEKWKWSRWVGSDSATPWTAAYQAPPSMTFSRQASWSGLPLPSPTLYIMTNKYARLKLVLLVKTLRGVDLQSPREPWERCLRPQTVPRVPEHYWLNTVEKGTTSWG